MDMLPFLVLEMWMVLRQKKRRGNRKRRVKRGAVCGKPTNMGVTQLKPSRNLRTLAETRAGRRFANMRVLNSYWINQDTTYKYFEVILVDPQHKTIRRDPRINWICGATHKHREQRGLTSAGRKARGMRNRGSKAAHIKPSKSAQWKRNNTLSLRRYRS